MKDKLYSALTLENKKKLQKYIESINMGYDKRGKGISQIFGQIGAEWLLNEINKNNIKL